jgi:F420-dependent oxidoreductase-like protein
MVIEGVFGMSFDKPVGHMRDYLEILGPLLRGEPASHSGERLSAQVGLEIGADPPPLLVAALGPKMLRLTAELADGTITWMTGPATLADHTIPTLASAREKLGRPQARVVAALPVAVTDDVEGTKARAAEAFAIYGVLPSYRAMLDREGAQGPEDVAIIGGADEVRERIAALAEIGVTDFAAVEFSGGEEGQATREVLTGLIGALRGG